MGKFWALTFFTVPVLGTLVFVISMMGAQPTSEALMPLPWERIWLPEDISRDGHRIDSLFMFCLYLTGAVFIATEGALVWFMLRYDKDAKRWYIPNFGPPATRTSKCPAGAPAAATDTTCGLFSNHG